MTLTWNTESKIFIIKSIKYHWYTSNKHYASTKNLVLPSLSVARRRGWRFYRVESLQSGEFTERRFYRVEILLSGDFTERRVYKVASLQRGDNSPHWPAGCWCGPLAPCRGFSPGNRQPGTPRGRRSGWWWTRSATSAASQSAAPYPGVCHTASDTSSHPTLLASTQKIIIVMIIICFCYILLASTPEISFTWTHLI